MINIDHITKIYNTIRALDSLTLIIKQGEVFGLLGPNGAGKTTTRSPILAFGMASVTVGKTIFRRWGHQYP